MIIGVIDEELRRLDELRRRGIPLDTEVLRNMRAACKGLVIRQAGTIAENAIFDSVFGETGFMLSIVIHNVSDRIIRPQGARLKIRWPQPHFRWLENPLAKVPREFTYSHPSFGPAGFDPELVVNHRLNGRCKLYPGDYLEGLLLGVGQAPMPDHYVDRQAVRIRLSVYDERGNRYTSDLILLVRREQKLGRQQTKESLRGGRELLAKNTQPGAYGTREAVRMLQLACGFCAERRLRDSLVGQASQDICAM